MCKMRGIEMTGPSELPHLRRAAEVGRAVRAGEKISSKEVVMHIDEPKAPPIPLAETLRKMGKQRAVAERAAVGFDNWSDRGAQSAAALAEKGRQVRHAGVAELRPANKAIDLT